MLKSTGNSWGMVRFYRGGDHTSGRNTVHLPKLHRCLVTVISLAFLANAGITPGLAAERMAKLTDVSIPKTDKSQPLAGLHVCGDWLVWTESELVSNPMAHVLDYRFEVFRSRIGTADCEKMLDIPRARFAVPFITTDGVVVVITRSKIWTNSGKETKQYKFKSGPPWSYPEIVFGEPVFAGTLADEKTGLFCVAKQGELKEIFSRLGPTAIHRQGNKVMWIEGDNIAVLDIPTEKLQVVGKVLTQGQRPTLDGLWGNWLFCHEGDLARFINTESGEELQLKAPGKIKYLCPDGILFIVDDYHYRFWDPVSQRIWDLLPKTHMELGRSPGSREELSDFYSRKIPGEEGASIYLSEPHWSRRPNRRYASAIQNAGHESEHNYHNTDCWYFNTKDPMREIPLASLKDQIALAAELEKAYESGQLSKNTWERKVRQIRWPYAPGTLSALRTVLNMDPNTGLRRRAAMRIAHSNDPAAKDILLQALKEEENYFVLEGMPKALTLLCDKSVAGPLIETSAKKGPGLIKETANALGVLGNPTALPYLNSISDATLQRLKSQRERAQEAAPDATRLAVTNAIRYITMRSKVEELLSSLRQTSDK